jgi:hypothetical protein
LNLKLRKNINFPFSLIQHSKFTIQNYFFIILINHPAILAMILLKTLDENMDPSAGINDSAPYNTRPIPVAYTGVLNSPFSP